MRTVTYKYYDKKTDVNLEFSFEDSARGLMQKATFVKLLKEALLELESELKKKQNEKA